jgi:hypothetical protein
VRWLDAFDQWVLSWPWWLQLAAALPVIGAITFDVWVLAGWLVLGEVWES